MVESEERGSDSFYEVCLEHIEPCYVVVLCTEQWPEDN